MVEDGAFSHKIDYVHYFLEIPNLEGHPNRITGSRVTAILLIGWILLIGGASAVKALRLAGLPRLFYTILCYNISYYPILHCTKLQYKKLLYITSYMFNALQNYMQRTVIICHISSENITGVPQLCLLFQIKHFHQTLVELNHLTQPQT